MTVYRDRYAVVKPGQIARGEEGKMGLGRETRRKKKLNGRSKKKRLGKSSSSDALDETTVGTFLMGGKYKTNNSGDGNVKGGGKEVKMSSFSSHRLTWTVAGKGEEPRELNQWQ